MYLRSSPDSQGERFLTGARFAAKKNGAILSVVNYGNAIFEDQRKRTDMGGAQAILQTLKTFSPDAVIIEYDRIHRLPAKLFSRCRVAVLDGHNAMANNMKIICDNASVSKAAFEELDRFGWRHFAYVNWFTASDWDKDRYATFRRLVEERGGTFLSHRPKRVGLLDEKFIRWVRTLPAETAVFAANDIIARNFVDAAEQAGRSIPLELAVVGADNNLQFCEGGQTSISSVERDVVGAGKSAVEALLADGPVKDVTFGALGVVRRESSVRVKGNRREVLLAHEFIRQNLGTGIDVDDVARELKIGRRTLERRIKAFTGKSIGEIIIEERFDLARRMLADKTMSVHSVADFCGYRSDSALRAMFAQRLGRSPDEYRKHAVPFGADKR